MKKTFIPLQTKIDKIYYLPPEMEKFRNNGLLKSQGSDDKVKRFRCKAHKHEGMRRTYWYAGLAERSQAMIHPVK